MTFCKLRNRLGTNVYNPRAIILSDFLVGNWFAYDCPQNYQLYVILFSRYSTTSKVESLEVGRWRVAGIS